MRLVCPALFLLSLLQDILHREETNYIAAIVLYTGVSIAVNFLIKPYLIIYLKIKMKNMKKDGKLQYDTEVVIQFYEDFLIDITNEIEVKAKYKSIDKIVFGKDAFYLFIDAKTAVILPFSVFKTEEEKEEFTAFIQSKTEKEKNC